MRGKGPAGPKDVGLLLQLKSSMRGRGTAGPKVDRLQQQLKSSMRARGPAGPRKIDIDYCLLYHHGVDYCSLLALPKIKKQYQSPKQSSTPFPYSTHNRCTTVVVSFSTGEELPTKNDATNRDCICC